MFEIPLFPLNTVLFPGSPISLHVFEERYKLMIRVCVETKGRFGVALIRRGFEALGPLPEPHAVGCTARIQEVKPLEGDRFALRAVGEERFRILNLKRDLPYLVGEVEPYPIDTGEPQTLEKEATDLRPWVERYLHSLGQLGGGTAGARRLPENPTAFAYIACALLNVPTADKQKLLGMRRATELLRELRGLYRREIALLAAISVRGRGDESGGPFSRN